MTDRFREQVALVTGAAGGIGRATAERLIADGARVVLSDIGSTRLAELAKDLGDRAAPIPANMAKPNEVRALIRDTIASFGRIDIVVNAAGILFPSRLNQITAHEWQQTLDVNLTGVFECIAAAQEFMVARGYGRIINISSSAGRSVSTLGGAHYTTSKAGLLGLTRAVAKELAPYGITVNAVCPGLIDTGMVRGAATPARLDEYAQSFPIGRLGQPSEVASLVCFLASAEAGYITGASIDINGGALMI